MINPVTKIASLHHVAISVEDMATSISFYQKLGFNVILTWADPKGSFAISHLALGPTVLELFSLRDGIDGPKTNRDPMEDLKIRGVRHFGLRVVDASQAHSDLTAAGLTPFSGVQRGNTGVDYFFIKDPDGILVELVQDDRHLIK